MRIKPKKKLGQNFLVDKNVQRKIIDSLNLASSDIVLEIGAGRGELTGLIAERAGKVYALEIDAALCNILRENLKNYPNIQIINQDILEFNFKRYFNRMKTKLTIVGNIPYYISSPIIESLISLRDKISAIFITVQKEFAQRLTASYGSKKYGSFSCFVQYYAKPKIIFTIKKTSFFPQPKVDSCFVQIDINKEKAALDKIQEETLFKIIRAAFNKRRKTLRNSLSGIVPPQKLEGFFTRYGIDRNIRPEALALYDFIRLTKF